MADWQSDDHRPVSAWMTLVWTGVIAASTWFANWWEGEETVRRDVYANKEDCVKDWGDERNCEAEPGLRPGTGHYYGPSYQSGQYGSPSTSKADGTVDAARPGSHAVGTAHVARGGFGGSGAAHGAHGS